MSALINWMAKLNETSRYWQLVVMWQHNGMWIKIKEPHGGTMAEIVVAHEALMASKIDPWVFIVADLQRQMEPAK